MIRFLLALFSAQMSIVAASAPPEQTGACKDLELLATQAAAGDDAEQALQRLIDGSYHCDAALVQRAVSRPLAMRLYKHFTLRFKADAEMSVANATSALERIVSIYPLWQAESTLGNLLIREKQFALAVPHLEAAIEHAVEPAFTPRRPDPKSIADLARKAESARLAAAALTDTHVASRSGRDGGIGGLFRAASRGCRQKTVFPVQFEFDSTRFTSSGRKYADELVRWVREKNPRKLWLIGHTDSTGSPEYNLALSSDRAAALADFLRNGLQGSGDRNSTGSKMVPEPAREGNEGETQQDIAMETRIETVGKGETEPYDPSPEVGNRLSDTERDQLNRRVEFEAEGLTSADCET